MMRALLVQLLHLGLFTTTADAMAHVLSDGPLVSAKSLEEAGDLQGPSALVTFTNVHSYCTAGSGTLDSTQADAEDWTCAAVTNVTSFQVTASSTLRGIEFYCGCPSNSVRVGLTPDQATFITKIDATCGTTDACEFDENAEEDDITLYGFYCNNGDLYIHDSNGDWPHLFQYGTFDEDTHLRVQIDDNGVVGWFKDGTQIRVATPSSISYPQSVFAAVQTTTAEGAASCPEKDVTSLMLMEADAVTTTTTGGGGGGSGESFGDPHCANIDHARFDINQVGMHKLVQIPRADPDDASELLLRVNAGIDHIGLCGPTYITNLTMLGTWLQEFGSDWFEFTYDGFKMLINGEDVEQAIARFPENTTTFDRNNGSWMTLVMITGEARAEIQLRQRQHIQFYNFKITGLVNLQAKGDIGGLLGRDDHKAEQKKSHCTQARSLDDFSHEMESSLSYMIAEGAE